MLKIELNTTNQCDSFLHSVLEFFSWKVLSKNVLKVFDKRTLLTYSMVQSPS